MFKTAQSRFRMFSLLKERFQILFYDAGVFKHNDLLPQNALSIIEQGCWQAFNASEFIFDLIFCDGHAEYRKNKQTSSLDWGLVGANGNDSPWQPDEAHSRATYFYK